MFRKTIAVLLMLSIVLSSCGKNDKDKSNDFVRVTTPPLLILNLLNLMSRESLNLMVKL
jgi:hypothetical protein